MWGWSPMAPPSPPLWRTCVNLSRQHSLKCWSELNSIALSPGYIRAVGNQRPGWEISNTGLSRPHAALEPLFLKLRLTYDVQNKKYPETSFSALQLSSCQRPHSLLPSPSGLCNFHTHDRFVLRPQHSKASKRGIGSSKMMMNNLNTCVSKAPLGWGKIRWW